MTLVFLIGSPRSGTTILEDILELHPAVTTWYEPIFVMDHYFKHVPHDMRTTEDAKPNVQSQIRKQFDYFTRAVDGKIILDKNPSNSMKIPFLEAVFHRPYYIHLLRDGRDATISINREWQTRQSQLTEKTTYLDALKTLHRFVKHQPLLKHKIQALLFEFGNPINLARGRKQATHRARRWEGRLGWGPQFPGWQDVIDDVSLLQFNAMQWQACVEAILEQQSSIEPERFLEVRYENFLQNPQHVLKQIFDFIQTDFPTDFSKKIPTIKSDNFDKWKTELSADQKEQIGPIIQSTLEKTGYASNESWFQ